MSEQTDILIVGGGPVGATLALVLKDSGLRVCLLEARTEVARGSDPRALALSFGTMQLLRRIGAWQRMVAPTAIETIHVSQRGGFGRAVLHAAQEKLEAFGWVVDYPALDAALHETLKASSGLRYLTGAAVKAVQAEAGQASAEFEQDGQRQTVSAKLLVLADGGPLAESLGIQRKVREYGQSALVAQVTTDTPHGHVAYERFTTEGPMALLPSADGFALVWTVAPDKAHTLCELDDSAFLQQLNLHFGGRAGRFIAVGKRSHFPLALRYAKPVTAQHAVVVGNAAQTLHPVAGQGFNLGIRDAWELASEILASTPADIGSAAMLARYQSKRRLDTGATMLVSDLLVRGFSNDWPLLSGARGMLLSAMDSLPLVKSEFAQRMMFGARG